jgi:ABC-type multidrug transport system fused ATPase/permease subunit
VQRLGPNVFSPLRIGKGLGAGGSARAGKSSLMVALLRLVELRVGRITIDGVDIASVPLHVRTAYR